MIKNQKQAAITKARLEELINAYTAFEQEHQDKSSTKYLLGSNSFKSLIKELQEELTEYDGLTTGGIHWLQAKELKEIPQILIKARLAQKKSQKELGALLGLKEQQIQRYEATDYETASWPRIIEVAMALDLNIQFEKNIIISVTPETSFEYPEGFSIDQVEVASNKVKQNGLLVP